MINNQKSELDGLMNFLLMKAEGEAPPPMFKFNQAKSSDFNHNNNMLDTNKKYPDAKVIDTKVAGEDALPPSSERVYFSTAQPPKDYAGEIYVGTRGANFWTPTAKQLKAANSEASDIIKFLTAEDKTRLHDWKDAVHAMPLNPHAMPLNPDAKEIEKMGKARDKFVDKLEHDGWFGLHDIDIDIVLDYLDKTEKKIMESKIYDDTATAPGPQDKAKGAGLFSNFDIDDEEQHNTKFSKTSITSEIMETFHEVELSKISEFVNSKAFQSDAKYRQLRKMFEFSTSPHVASSHHDMDGSIKTKVKLVGDAYWKLILGKSPSKMQKLSMQYFKVGYNDWTTQGHATGATFLKYWLGELTDAPLNYGRWDGDSHFNPDHMGVYKNGNEPYEHFKRIKDALQEYNNTIKIPEDEDGYMKPADARKKAFDKIGAVGKYSKPTTIKAAQSLMERIDGGIKFQDSFMDYYNDEISGAFSAMKEAGYEPFQNKSDYQIEAKNMQYDDMKKHMRALYRETFGAQQKLSAAIYAYTHPDTPRINLWRGTNEEEAMIEVFGSTPGLPPNLVNMTEKEIYTTVQKKLGVDITKHKNEGHPINVNMSSAQGFSTKASFSAGSYVTNDGFLIKAPVEPKNIIAPYPMLSHARGGEYAEEYEVGVLRNDAGGMPASIWSQEHAENSLQGIKVKGKDGNITPIEVKLSADDWQSPEHPKALTSLHQSLGGSNSGSVMKSKDGNQYYVKTGNESQSVVEHLTNQLYQKAGVPVHDAQLIQYGGTNAFMTPYAKDAKDMTSKDMAAHKDVQEGFVIDAWLGNWDVVGSGNSNIKNIGGKAIRVDVGGSLYMRANQGTKADSEFFGATDVVTELESLRGKGSEGSKATHTKPVFENITDEHLQTGATMLSGVSNQDILDLVKDSKIPDEHKNKLAHTLQLRRDTILKAIKIEKQETEEIPYPNIVDESKLLTFHIVDDTKKHRTEKSKKAEEDDQK